MFSAAGGNVRLSHAWGPRASGVDIGGESQGLTFGA